MIGKDAWGKCYGSTTVGSHGQIVIPAEARRELGIEFGNKFLVFNSLNGRALILVEAAAIGQLVNVITNRLTEFETIIKQSTVDKSAETAKE